MNIFIKLFFSFVAIFLFSSSFFTCVEAVEGIILKEDSYRVETFKCLKEQLSAEFVIVFASHTSMSNEIALYKSAELNIKNAHTAGFEDIDIHINSCLYCFQPSENIIIVLNHLNENNATFGNVWLSVYGLVNNTNYAGWKKDKVKNVKFINEIVTTLINNNQTYGILTAKYEWHEITGNTQIFNNSSLLYVNDDNLNNFDDYYEYGYFGGWEKPKMKLYSYKEVCGLNVTNVWRS